MKNWNDLTAREKDYMVHIHAMDGQEGENVPFYTTDWSAAGSLVDKMTASRWSLDLDQNTEANEATANFYFLQSSQHLATRTTIQEAICLAALIAMGIYMDWTGTPADEEDDEE